MILPYADENPHAGTRWAVLALIGANVAMLLALGPLEMRALGLVAADPRPYQWLSHQFAHAGWGHLIANMWFLWIFGDNVEWRMRRGFLPFYLAAGAVAAALHARLHAASQLPLVGASGAVSGVIGAYLVYFPSARLRCVTFALLYPIRYSVRAWVFGLAYIGMQYAMASIVGVGGGVAYGAHLGGALFGIAAALASRLGRAPALAASGEAGKAPLEHDARPEPGGVRALAESGEEERAVADYVQALRRDPYFALEDRTQLWIGDRLARAGRPHLAKDAIERFLLRHPASAHAAHAELLLGYVEQAFFHDFAAAGKAFARARARPDAGEATRKDAEARLAGVRGVLAKTALGPPSAGQRHAILREDSSAWSEADFARAASVLGARISDLRQRAAGDAGYLARGLDLAAASTAASELERAGIPVVVLPEPGLLQFPATRLCSRLESGAPGLTAVLADGSRETVAWKDCLLLAAAGLRPGPGEREGALIVEVVAENPLRRLRWRRAQAGEDAFWDCAQKLLVDAPQVPVEAGLQAAFRRRLPEEQVFDHPARWDAYLAWQAQLARLRRGGAFAPWGAPAL